MKGSAIQFACALVDSCVPLEPPKLPPDELDELELEEESNELDEPPEYDEPEEDGEE